ncbi:hypothetical protein [Rhodococcus koreensis]|uniref:hypothetical protein n=1 Tax=Rhodococcus koreensis TaxID=99653 RepID=UPI00197E4BE6|nr:hypothetical protein [Rhodococcus koreensis]QSE85355.1 hypothetical protein JWS14_28860 [Rhodococcus koreensis]
MAEMSWNDFRARRAVLEEVLARAHVDPAVALRFDEVPGAIQLFGSADNILLALQHRWSNHLAARLDQAVEDGTPVNAAWRALASEQPALRALLDAAAASSVPLRGSQRDEQRMIEAHTTGRVSGHRSDRRTTVLSGGSSR